MSEEQEVKAASDVVADINYFPATGIPIPTSEWKPRYLGISDKYTRRMTIRDVRRTTKTFDLATNGFQFVKLPPQDRVTAADDEETIKRDYYPELEALVRTLTGASTVFAFNHVLRTHTSPTAKGKFDEEKGRWQDIPVGHPHVDYSGDPEHIAATQLELIPILPSHIFSLYPPISSRFAYINVWRPLSPIRRDPFAVCDCTSIPASDYQIRLREFKSGIKGGNYVLGHGEAEERHEWWWMSGMGVDECVVFREFVSERAGGWRCPHTAFQLPGTEDLPSRESIETRLVCFWE